MLRIGLLISALEEENICEFCHGAICAADDIEVSLTIIPGGQLKNLENPENEKNYEYQKCAAFDYITGQNFEGLLIDIEQIAKDISILKTEKFLNSFQGEGLKFMLLSHLNGYKEIKVNKNMSPREKGYKAVIDIVSFVEDREINAEVPKISDIPINAADAMYQLNLISSKLVERNFEGKNVYSEILKISAMGGLKEAAILLYGQGMLNTVKNPWIVPERILVKGLLVDGNERPLDEVVLLDTLDVMRNVDSVEIKKGGFIARTLYIDDKQIGIFLVKIDSAFLIKDFESILFKMVKAVINKYYDKKTINDLSEEVLALQEEIEKDDSILEHISEKDYMTGEYNRRGFFEKAYEQISGKFNKNTFALMSYVKIDSIRSINEIYGREEGNITVKRISKKMHELFDETVVIGRVRGDEFASFVIADDEDEFEKTLRKLENLEKELNSNNEKNYKIRIKYSVSISEYNSNFNLSDMLRENDEKLKEQ